jgi:copper chaperone CopZ
MFRRKFIAGLTLAGAGAMASGADTRKVTFRIAGFSCITCAVGLDTMMRDKAGVVHSQSSYQDAKTTIEFKPKVVSEEALKAFIAEMGFTATRI